MDFGKIKPTETSRPERAQEAGLAFDVTLVEDTHDRVSRPNPLNEVLVPLVAVLLLLAPIPLGGNRPQPWAAYGVISGLVAMAYFANLYTSDRTRAPHFPLHRGILAAGLVMPVFGLMQIVPLWDWASGETVTKGMAGNTLSLIPSATALAVLRSLAYLLVFVVVIEICARETRVRQMQRILFYGITAHAMWAMAALRLFGDIAPWGPKTLYLGWATGTFVNRNSFATFLGMGAVIGVVYVLDRANRRRTRRPDKDSLLSPYAIAAGIDWLCVIIIYAAILATGSRMGLAATTVAMIGVAGVMGFKTRRHRRASHDKGTSYRRRSRYKINVARPLMYFAVAIGLIGFLSIFGGSVAERAIYTEGDSKTRFELYAQTLDLIAERPFVGFGLDSFAISFPLIHTPEMNVAKIWDLAHNTYLGNWAEMGVIAGSAPLLAVLLAALRNLSIVRARPNYVAGPVAALGVIGLAGVHSLADFSLEMAANTLLFVAIVAMGLSQWRAPDAAAAEKPS